MRYLLLVLAVTDVMLSLVNAAAGYYGWMAVFAAFAVYFFYRGLFVAD